MKRVGFFLFYDNCGIVDDYIIFLLEDMKKYVNHMIFIVNGLITEDSRAKVEKAVDEILIRKNIGYDVWGYKEGLETFGYQNLEPYDEIILLNYTFFGPIFPFSEMFDKMEATDCDFWGLAAYDGIYGYHEIGYFLQSMFIIYRKKLFLSDVFKDYWENMPMIESKDALGNSSFLVFEAKFAEYFKSKGFSYSAYLDACNYPTREAFYLNIDMMVEDGCPILKRRVFLNDPIHDDVWCVNNRKALDYIEKNSDFDMKLIWDNILRTTELRTVVTNAELLSVLPDNKEPVAGFSTIKNIGVIAHVFADSEEPDIAEMAEYVSHIFMPYDLYITVENQQGQDLVSKIFSPNGNLKELHMIPPVQDGDIAAFLIEWKDILLHSKYDLICKVYAKKIRHGINYTKNDMMKYYLMDNLLTSPGFVSEIFNRFEKEPRLGIVCPPCPHMGTDIFGHTWKNCLKKAMSIAIDLGLDVHFDRYTPLATYGRMFWARPQALTRLVEYKWNYDSFKVDQTQQKIQISKWEANSIKYQEDALKSGLTELRNIANSMIQNFDSVKDGSQQLNETVKEITKRAEAMQDELQKISQAKKLPATLCDSGREYLGVEAVASEDVEILAGAIERLITYCAQFHRYYTGPVFCPKQAARSYLRLENKAELVYAKKNDFVQEMLNNPDYTLGCHRALKELLKAFRMSIQTKHPKIGQVIMPPLRFVKNNILKPIYHIFKH